MSPLRRILTHATGVPPSCGPVRVIGIDGRSGAGKSTLARRLADQWSAPLVSMDEIYPGWDGLAAAVPLLVDHVLVPMARGETPTVPTWDWSAGVPGPRRDLEVRDRLVVEGCGSTVAAAGAFSGTRVWLDGTAEVRRARAIGRDGALFAEHWRVWAEQEDELFTADDTRGRAHLVLDLTTDPA